MKKSIILLVSIFLGFTGHCLANGNVPGAPKATNHELAKVMPPAPAPLTPAPVKNAEISEESLTKALEEALEEPDVTVEEIDVIDDMDADDDEDGDDDDDEDFD